MRIAVLGLGRMGWHMAAHLAGEGASHDLVVFDVVEGLGGRWADEHGGEVADSVASAVAGADFIVTSLPSDRELQTVADELVPAIADGTVWVDHSTTSAQLARSVETSVSAAGGYFLDASVSGGVDGARRGVLSVMVGGDDGAFVRAEPVVGSYAARVRHMGGPGAGQLTKMTNQICVVGLCQALAEGLDFASRAGLDVNNVVEVMLQGSSTSWQMENRARTMLDRHFDHGFALDWMRKDFGIVFDEAERIGATLPVTAMVDQFYARLQREGHGRWDTSSLIELLRDD